MWSFHLLLPPTYHLRYNPQWLDSSADELDLCTGIARSRVMCLVHLRQVIVAHKVLVGPGIQTLQLFQTEHNKVKTFHKRGSRLQ